MLSFIAPVVGAHVAAPWPDPLRPGVRFGIVVGRVRRVPSRFVCRVRWKDGSESFEDERNLGVITAHSAGSDAEALLRAASYLTISAGSAGERDPDADAMRGLSARLIALAHRLAQQQAVC